MSYETGLLVIYIAVPFSEFTKQAYYFCCELHSSAFLVNLVYVQF